MKKPSLSETILRTLEAESSALSENISRSHFVRQIQEAALKLSQVKRVIVTGMGKSGLIARKVAATFISTGSPAVFLHPADALHGDIGHIGKGEIVLAYSNSGETKEIIELLPHIKALGGRLIAVSGRLNSTLVKEADAHIIYDVAREGCPLDLAPMASTTLSLAIGDAIAAALIRIKEFKPNDFSRFHPSGSLGKRLLTKVKDVFLSCEGALVNKNDNFHVVITKMVTTNLGAVIVLGSKGHLRGIITDGDIKRHLDANYRSEEGASLATLWNKRAEDIMVKEPHSVPETVLVEEALAQMNANQIYILPVLNKSKKVSGIVRMHDLMGLKST